MSLLRRFGSCSLLILALGSLAGVEGDPWAGFDRLLRIEDGIWLRSRTAALATAAGEDPARALDQLARRLFIARSLLGLDPGRRVQVGLRDGWWYAALPVSDRRRASTDLGLLPDGEPPLVRTGDADGAAILIQNHPSGPREYRLLVVDDVAYLAPTIAACRILASKPPGVPPADGVIATYQSGPATGDVSRFLLASFLPAQAASLAALCAPMSQQVDRWDWTLRRSGPEVVLEVVLQPQVNSPLATWTQRQSNLPPQLPALAMAPAWLHWEGHVTTGWDPVAVPAALAPYLSAGTMDPASQAAWDAVWELALGGDVQVGLVAGSPAEPAPAFAVHHVRTTDLAGRLGDAAHRLGAEWRSAEQGGYAAVGSPLGLAALLPALSGPVGTGRPAILRASWDLTVLRQTPGIGVPPSSVWAEVDLATHPQGLCLTLRVPLDALEAAYLQQTGPRRAAPPGPAGKRR